MAVYFNYLYGKRLVWFIFYGVVAFVAVLLIMIVGTKVHLGRGRLAAVTVLLILVATIEMWHTGSKNVVAATLKATPQKFQLDIARMDELSFKYARTDTDEY